MDGQAQQGVLAAAYADARLKHQDASALEAHGTGTALGDPIEASAISAIFLSQRIRQNVPLSLGSLKANAGHTEPGAGLAGALKLLPQLHEHVLPPNAHLRHLNPHVSTALRGSAFCALQTQVGAVLERAGHGSDAGGVSSFGYSGTIAHAVLCARDASIRVHAYTWCAPFTYRRHSFAWRAVSCAQLFPIGYYSSSFVRCLDPVPRAGLLRRDFVAFSATAAAPRNVQSSVALRSAFIIVCLGPSDSSVTSLAGNATVLAVAQHAAALYASHLLLLTCGANPARADMVRPAAAAAHGGAWGLGRVMRLEVSSVLSRNVDSADDVSVVAMLPLFSDAHTEGEQAWRGVECFGARLRSSYIVARGSSAAIAAGVYAITGGLGGLGLRAAALLLERGARRVVLSSRSGRVARDGQGLSAQLQALGARSSLLACDSSDGIEGSVLMSSKLPVGDKGLLADLEASRMSWMLLAKVVAASTLHCSSLVAGLGNVGQANYATGNSSLDISASLQRAVGVVSCSLQWPLVGGAGMGAAAAAALHGRGAAVAGMAMISLEQYAACLDSQLCVVLSSVRMAHRAKARVLLDDLADAHSVASVS